MRLIIHIVFVAYMMLVTPIIAAEQFDFNRPGDARWPTHAEWQALNDQVGGHLIQVPSPFSELSSKNARSLLMNPYFITEHPGATQTSGWVGAWHSAPSAYGVQVQNADHIVAAVNFARKHNIRLVIKSGGHSYQGTSNAPDSLLIWMRDMNDIELVDAFVPDGAGQNVQGVPAVTIETGARWLPVYEHVTTKARRYVQGGGCATVAVGGLISSGGFGSFSKMYGMAAASLLEAEIITADGEKRTVNEFKHPELFWAIKGGGGGSFGVISKVTLKTHELPATFGAANMTIQAKTNHAYRTLINEFFTFYRDALMNPAWGESVMFKKDNSLAITMVFAGLTRDQAKAIWKPFITTIRQSPDKYSLISERVVSMPAHHWWDAAYRKMYYPKSIVKDSREHANEGNVYWTGNQAEVGIYLYGYDSLWLPKKLLGDDDIDTLVKGIYRSTRYYDVGIHFNKGFAGSSEEVLKGAKNTPMNPAVLDAFGLVIVAGGEGGYPKMTSSNFDQAKAEKHQRRIKEAIATLRQIAPSGGAYVSEADYFDKEWRERYWGGNYNRLKKVKDTYDPKGLFTVHHGVGVEKRVKKGFLDKIKDLF